jgi:hypothetical protein
LRQGPLKVNENQYLSFENPCGLTSFLCLLALCRMWTSFTALSSFRASRNRCVSHKPQRFRSSRCLLLVFVQDGSFDCGDGSSSRFVATCSYAHCNTPFRGLTGLTPLRSFVCCSSGTLILIAALVVAVLLAAAGVFFYRRMKAQQQMETDAQQQAFAYKSAAAATFSAAPGELVSIPVSPFGWSRPDLCGVELSQFCACNACRRRRTACARQ